MTAKTTDNQFSVALQSRFIGWCNNTSPHLIDLKCRHCHTGYMLPCVYVCRLTDMTTTAAPQSGYS